MFPSENVKKKCFSFVKFCFYFEHDQFGKTRMKFLMFYCWIIFIFGHNIFFPQSILHNCNGNLRGETNLSSNTKSQVQHSLAQ